MGCSHSSEKSAGRRYLYASAVTDDGRDAEILALWNKFLRGDSTQWKTLVISDQTGSTVKHPALYWSDLFKNNMVQNIARTNPHIASELESRNIRQSARILTGIMEHCLLHVIIDNGSVNPKNETAGEDKLDRIARAHCKWSIHDADYINVENAMMDAMRSCLGEEFTSRIEVRLRYKYGLVKNVIQRAQDRFEVEQEEEASKLKEATRAKVENLKEKTVSNENEAPRSKRYPNIIDFSVGEYQTQSALVLTQGGFKKE